MPAKTYPTTPPQQAPHKLKPVPVKDEQSSNREKLAEKITGGNFMKGIGGLTAMTKQLVAGSKTSISLMKETYAQDRVFFQKMGGWSSALLASSMESANAIASFNAGLMEMSAERSNKSLDVGESQIGETKSPVVNIVNKITESGGIWKAIKSAFKEMLIMAAAGMAGILAGVVTGLFASAGVGAAIAAISATLTTGEAVLGKAFSGLNSRFLDASDKFIGAVSGGASKIGTFMSDVGTALSKGEGFGDLLLRFFARIERVGGVTGKIATWAGDLALDMELAGGIVSKALSPLRSIFTFFGKASSTFGFIFGKLTWLTSALRFFEPLMKRLPVIAGVFNVLSHIGEMFAAFDSRHMVDSVFKLFRDIPKYFLSGLAGVVGFDVKAVEGWFDGIISDMTTSLTDTFTKLFSGDYIGFLGDALYGILWGIPKTVTKWILQAAGVALSSAAGLVKTFLIKPITWVLGMLGFDKLGKSLATAFDDGLEVINMLPMLFNELWVSTTSKLKSVGLSIWGSITSLGAWAKDTFWTKPVAILGGVADIFADLGAWVKDTFWTKPIAVFNEIGGMFASLGGNIGDSIGNLFTNFVSGVYDWVTGVFDVLPFGLGDKFKGIVDSVLGGSTPPKVVISAKPVAVEAFNQMRTTQNDINRLDQRVPTQSSVTANTVKTTTAQQTTINNNSWESPRDRIPSIAAF